MKSVLCVYLTILGYLDFVATILHSILFIPKPIKFTFTFVLMEASKDKASPFVGRLHFHQRTSLIVILKAKMDSALGGHKSKMMILIGNSTMDRHNQENHFQQAR